MSDRKLNPHVSVDCVLLGFESEELHVLLIDRGHVESLTHDPDIQFALPGDLIYSDEDLYTGARRILNDLTGLENVHMEQFGAFGDPDRLSRDSDRQWLRSLRTQPEERVVTIGYYTLVKMTDHKPVASSFARATKWVPLREVGQLAFDHNLILDKALNSLRRLLRNQPIGIDLLPPKFTLGKLQKLYEAIQEKELDKRNFRRKVLKLGIVRELAEKQEGVAHKPARYFEFDRVRYEELLHEGFGNFKL